MQQVSDWLAGTALNQAIATTAWAIPGIQTVHILALAVVFTAALLLSLRLAGAGLSVLPLARLAAHYTRLIWLMLAVLLVSGGLLIVAEPGRTLVNPVFYAKMLLLLAAVALTLWLAAAARREAGNPAPLQALLAALAVVLWICIIFAGRFIAYVED